MLNNSSNNKLTIEVFSKEYYDKAFDEIEKTPSNWYPSKITEFIRKKLNTRISLVLPIKKELFKTYEIHRARVLKDGE
jgi:hypothetical protein